MFRQLLVFVLSAIMLMPVQAEAGSLSILSQGLSRIVDNAKSLVSRSGVFVDQPGNVSKDPFVLEINDKDFMIVWGDIAARTIVARRYSRTSLKPLKIEPVSDMINVTIDVPDESPQSVRWAPSLAFSENKLYLYYTKGLVHGSSRPGAENPWGIQWDSFRIYVADTQLTAGIEELGKGIKQLNFTNERLLMTTPNFAFKHPDFGGSPHFGVIDQEIVRHGKDLYCYYVVVTQGIEGVRPHEEFIRVQKMKGYDSTEGPDLPVYDGKAGAFGDQGVAEAPNAFIYKGIWYLIYSSRPSDGDQRIMITSARDPMFKKKSRPVVLLSPRREDFDSIGGQAFVRLRDKGNVQHYVLYQGYKKGKEGWPFYLAPIDDFLRVIQFFSSIPE